MRRLEVEDLARKVAPMHTPDARRKAAESLGRKLRQMPTGQMSERLAASMHSPAAVAKRGPALRLAGVARRAALLTEEIRRAYEAGESMKSLSSRTGLSRTVLGVALSEAGVAVRGRSDAERLKWAAMRSDRAAVERQCGRAWDAARGREKTREELEKAARTSSARLRRRGRYEDELAEELRRGGLPVTQQRPVNRYCIDVAIEEPRVAVEIFGAYPSTRTIARRPERTEQLAREGWTVVEVHAYRRDGVCVRPRDKGRAFKKTVRIAPLFNAGALREHLVSLVNVLRSDPSARGQHRMIDGQGEPLPEIGVQRYHWSDV